MKKNQYILITVILVVGVALAAIVYEKALKNHELSIDELKLYAHQGDPDAQNKLGAAYFHGKGVEKNAGEAEKWFRQSAEKGYAKAQYNLGVMYYQGAGVAQNYSEAFKMYTQAAQKGYALAQYNLGLVYLQGVGVPKDQVTAYMWIFLASEKNVPDAVKNRVFLDNKMAPAQLEKARKLAGEWKPKN